MKFLVALVKNGDPITMIDFGGTIGQKWATTTQAVVNFAKANLKGHTKDGSYAGDEVTVEYTVNNAKYNVTKITKVGGTSAPIPNNDTTATGKPTCSDCGKEVKDAKYKKCFKCNEKNPAPRSGASVNKGSDVNASIKKQAIGHMTSRSLVALQGQVDVNTLPEIIKSLYKLYTDLVG